MSSRTVAAALACGARYPPLWTLPSLIPLPERAIQNGSICAGSAVRAAGRFRAAHNRLPYHHLPRPAASLQVLWHYRSAVSGWLAGRRVRRGPPGPAWLRCPLPAPEAASSRARAGHPVPFTAVLFR
jgi:hypothetical protein